MQGSVRPKLLLPCCSSRNALHLPCLPLEVTHLRSSQLAAEQGLTEGLPGRDQVDTDGRTRAAAHHHREGPGLPASRERLRQDAWRGAVRSCHWQAGQGQAQGESQDSEYSGDLPEHSVKLCQVGGNLMTKLLQASPSGGRASTRLPPARPQMTLYSFLQDSCKQPRRG